MKRTFRTELACVFGIVFVARGVVLMEKTDFGVSMVVAPAYLLYRWLSPAWSFVTFAWRNTACRRCCCSPYACCCGTDGRGVKCLASLCAGAQRKKLPRFVRRAAEAVK